MILFLRLAWATGQAGVVGVVGIFAIAETQAILTVLSLAAIVSNGQMRGGGAYYMISRNLGPEVGGSVGLLFYSAYAVGCTFYVIGLATAIRDTFFQHSTNDYLVLLIGTLCLLVVLAMALGGADFFTKINTLLFVIQFGSILVGMIAMCFPGKKELIHGGEYLGPSGSTFRSNVKSDYVEDSGCDGVCNFAKVFAILFPAATGIMEGANLSGDLKDPGKSIGKGTLYALITSIVIYMAMVMQFASAFPRSTLQGNTNAFQDACFSQYIVVVGIIISTASSALGALFGGSRLLQAIATDELFPIKFFAKGSKKGNEPRRAVIATWFVAQLGLFIGDLDAVAPIISSFFCLSYAFTNFACFFMAVSGTINFRPRFRYFSWHSALAGGILNVGVMFYLNFWYASGSILAMVLIFVYLGYTAPATDWGDIRQAIIFHQVRKYLLALDSARAEHGKLWRPSLLLYVDNLDGPLVSFCNSLKKGGVYILGTVIVGQYGRHADEVREIRGSWLRFIDQSGIKAFPQLCTAPSARLGFQSLLQMAGLGAMTPNTVVLPMFNKAAGVQGRPRPGQEMGSFGSIGASSRSLTAFYCQSVNAMSQNSFETSFLNTAVEDALEYVGVLSDVVVEDKNMVVACGFSELDTVLIPGGKNEQMTIDVWMTQPHGTETWAGFAQESLFMVQMAHILVATKRTNIRVFRVVEPGTDVQAERERVAGLIAESRIDVEEIVVIPFDMMGVGSDGSGMVGLDEETRRIRIRIAATSPNDVVGFDVICRLNSLIREHVQDTTYLVFAPLPTLPTGLEPRSMVAGDDEEEEEMAGRGILAANYVDTLNVLTSVPAPQSTRRLKVPVGLVATASSGSFMSRDI